MPDWPVTSKLLCSGESVLTIWFHWPRTVDSCSTFCSANVSRALSVCVPVTPPVNPVGMSKGWASSESDCRAYPGVCAFATLFCETVSAFSKAARALPDELMAANRLDIFQAAFQQPDNRSLARAVAQFNLQQNSRSTRDSVCSVAGGGVAGGRANNMDCSNPE